ncbi:putative amino-acid permease PB24D3.02c [Pseudocercospora fuligena]|uniref:Putative amino-acid permease PB24D3.02c n=1 Tax=Pseudocercospora fuligena TaxID=685502 RepID=A0A8H6VHM5_9PEZI|nr:putative amino-acid permease PB24D3.02c [Pseudocercospora fuligena]
MTQAKTSHYDVTTNDPAPKNETSSDFNETVHDRIEMERFGNRRRLRRSLNAVTVGSFMVIAMTSWAYVLNGASLGLFAAGTGGTIFVYIGTSVCYASIIVSMAELASMIPLAGGPYHWVSVLAGKRWRRVLSYAAGWLLTLSWMCGVASGLFIVAQLIRITAAIGDATANPQAWQTYLIVIAVTLLCMLMNTAGVRFLPLLELAAGIVFTVGFIASIVVYAVMAPKNDASAVFLTFTNGGEWSNFGFAMLTAQTFALYCLFGSDGAAHMSEETRNASLNVPRGMLLSYIFSAVTGFAMLVLFCFCYTEDAVAATELYGYAFIGVNLVATGSIAGAKGMTSIVLVLTILSVNNFVAASSRQLMAFARDGGVPFGKWVARISPGAKYPRNAVLVVGAFSIILSLITLGSAVAFQAVVSLTLIAFLGNYELSTCVLIWRRLSGLPLPPARWSLGRFGLPINLFAAAYGLFALVFVAVPATPEYNPTTFNWAPVVFVGLVVLAVLYYAFDGRKSFDVPLLKSAQEEDE